MRTLIIIIALVLIFIIAKRLWQKPRPPTQSGPGRQPNQQQGKMVQCANCGIYIPEQDAFNRGDRLYCSQAHLDEDMHN